VEPVLKPHALRRRTEKTPFGFVFFTLFAVNVVIASDGYYYLSTVLQKYEQVRSRICDTLTSQGVEA